MAEHPEGRGRDGYSEGTFGYVVWGDGGYPSRALAAEAARKVGEVEVQS